MRLHSHRAKPCPEIHLHIGQEEIQRACIQVDKVRLTYQLYKTIRAHGENQGSEIHEWGGPTVRPIVQSTVQSMVQVLKYPEYCRNGCFGLPIAGL